jgi:hypothetical protein
MVLPPRGEHIKQQQRRDEKGEPLFLPQSSKHTA